MVEITLVGMTGASHSRPTRVLPMDWVARVVRGRRSCPMEQVKQAPEKEVP